MHRLQMKLAKLTVKKNLMVTLIASLLTAYRTGEPPHNETHAENRAKREHDGAVEKSKPQAGIITGQNLSQF